MARKVIATAPRNKNINEDNKLNEPLEDLPNNEEIINEALKVISCPDNGILYIDNYGLISVGKILYNGIGYRIEVRFYPQSLNVFVDLLIEKNNEWRLIDAKVRPICRCNHGSEGS